MPSPASAPFGPVAEVALDCLGVNMLNRRIREARVELVSEAELAMAIRKGGLGDTPVSLGTGPIGS
jgi:hypothetical protein